MHTKHTLTTRITLHLSFSPRITSPSTSIHTTEPTTPPPPPPPPPQSGITRVLNFRVRSYYMNFIS